MGTQACSFGSSLILSIIQAIVFGIVMNVSMIVIFRSAGKVISWLDERKAERTRRRAVKQSQELRGE